MENAVLTTASAPVVAARATPPRITPAPGLLVPWESWPRSFLRNMADVFRAEQPPLKLTSPPGRFWSDVFVSQRLQKRSFAISLVYHAGFVSFIYLFSLAVAQSKYRAEESAPRTTLTYYQVSEYLPEIRSNAPAKRPRKGEPAYSRQEIISVPLEPNNREQIVVNPANIKLLPHHVRLPNLAVWTPVLAAAPSSAVTRSTAALTFPLAPVVVAPAASATPRQISNLKLPAVPVPSVVQPPPDNSTLRQLSELNMMQSKIEVVEPKLPVPEQRASGTTEPQTSAAPAKTTQAATPPPPSLPNTGSNAAGRLIALGLAPDVAQGPIVVPDGSRSGEFAATPSGRPDAPGTPEIKAESTAGTGGGGKTLSGAGTADGGNGPGISVGPGATPMGTPAAGSNVVAQNPDVLMSEKPRLLASVTPPHVNQSMEPSSPRTESGKLDDSVFGGRKYYSLTLNMPNLTSAGGSWVIRFAELTDKPTPGELTAPVAIEKVDPAYPPDLIQDRVEGVVTLYAVIASDGKVREVRVLRGLEDRLDANARHALTQWRFHPALRNGVPVDLEAVVQIPFKVRKLPF